MQRKEFLIGLAGVFIGVLLSTTAIVLAGNLNPSAGPGEPGSQMYTLEQIYNRLDSGITTTKMTAFTEPGSAPGTSTMHTLDEIYNLIGQRAPVPKTGQTITYTMNDDGELQKGIAWPSPRFITGTTGVVTDTLTGLVWLRIANCFGTKIWETALTDANILNDGECGLSDGSAEGDWRLPNLRELQSLIDVGFFNPALSNTAGTGKWKEGDPFTGVLDCNITTGNFWTSTTHANDTLYAWHVNLTVGNIHDELKATTLNCVWPVRGGY